MDFSLCSRRAGAILFPSAAKSAGATTSPKEETNMKKLYRSRSNKIVAGVCGGIGEYFNVDPTLIRLGVVALSFMFGGGFIAYIIAAIVIPAE